MGQMEAKNAKRVRRANLQRIILETVSAAGIISVALVAPNVLRAIKKLGFIPLRREREYIRAARDRLVRQGFLAYQNGMLRPTSRGEETLRILNAARYQITKPKRWDRKWRVLIFDIPEERKVVRERIRKILSGLGFVRVQDSVWLYPYDCEDIIALLKTDLRIGKEMLYLIVDMLEGDEAFRNHFSLKK